MRVKKKDLRKRLPQLPINYPGPVVEVPFNYELEANRVENLCRRLADNEVETRDAVLKELPRFILDVCSRTEFAQLTKQQNLPADFSYADLADFLGSSPSSDGSSTAATKKSVFFTEGVRDLSLLFDKLNLGIFFTFWHSDKPLVQHECAHRIALLCHVPPSNFLKLLFWRSMWRAIADKWSIIDQYRMDKYMAYVRKLVFQNLKDILDVTLAEARPVTWSSEGASSSSSSFPPLASADDILVDAMRLVGNDYNLQKYNTARLSFKEKFAKHLARKRERREAHEAAMAAKNSKKKGKKAKKDAAKSAAAGKKKKNEDGDDEEGDDEEVEEDDDATNKKKRRAVLTKQHKGLQPGKKSDGAAATDPQKKPCLPAQAVFLVAFADMVRTEVFRRHTSIGLSMHVIDVIVDELRRSIPTHTYPSFILAILFALPISAMANCDVAQIERRVQLMVVQPIAGGVLEKMFVAASAAARLQKMQEQKLQKGLSFDEDDESGDDENADDAPAEQQQQQANAQEVAYGVAKSVALAEATGTILKQTGLDPRTKFLMRAVFEEAARAVSGYVLHRKRPNEFTRVTAADKRRMLNAAVKRQMFAQSEQPQQQQQGGSGAKGGARPVVAADAQTAKLLRKKKLQLAEKKRKKLRGEVDVSAAGVRKQAKKKAAAAGGAAEKLHHRRRNKKAGKKAAPAKKKR